MIRKNILIFFLLVLSTSAFAEQKVQSKIERVTVFLNGAQVFRTAKVNLKAGNNTLVIEDISPYIQKESIQVKTGGDYQLLDAKYNLFYPKPEPSKKVPDDIEMQILRLEETLVEISFDLNHNKETYSALQKEKKMLWDNKLMNAQGKSDSLPILISSLGFFKDYMADLEKRVYDNRREEYVLLQRRKTTQEKVNELRNYKQQFERPAQQKTVHQIMIDVSAERATTGFIEVSYLVTNAGWRPSYDLRVISNDKPMEFTYKAEVFQSTGNEWHNIELAVSTSDPFKRNQMPLFNPFYVNLMYPHQVGRSSYGIPMTESVAADGVSDMKKPSMREQNEAMLDMSAKAVRPAAVARVAVKPVHVEFTSRHRHDIASDGKVNNVLLKDYEVDGKIDHMTIPRLEQKAYLIASMVDWEVLNLLPGKANLFLEDTYVGKTYLNPQFSEDTMRITMGQDEAIFIDRKKLGCVTSSSLLGGKKTKEYTYEISLRNNKTRSVMVKVLDQIPLSNNEEVEVELVDAEGATYTKSLGKMEWDLELDPKEEYKIIFKYKVTYPSEKVLSGV